MTVKGGFPPILLELIVRPYYYSPP
jgi:hypothetical protein